ncbi:hypothetical protein [Pseudomonas ovata]|uniref:hypothetical protein n=1 Tax=Pseudomonas ovata TaxID=1839709 RepID=UPI000D68C2DE|nr:hypothetical protein [Pseudomonas ovata]
MTMLSRAHNRLSLPLEGSMDAVDTLRLLMNSFEMYHEMMLALMTKELRHLDPNILSHWTDGIDGLADSLRQRAILLDDYLAPDSGTDI